MRTNIWVSETNKLIDSVQLIDLLCSMDACVCILEGNSGCGKTTLLMKLQECSPSPIVRVSCDTVSEALYQAIRRWSGDDIIHELLLRSEVANTYCIEDIDYYLWGRPNTQELIGQVIKLAVKRQKKLILTGTKIRDRVDFLINELESTPVYWFYSCDEM